MHESDHTAIDIRADALTERMRGVAAHGNTPFDVPYMSHIKGNLWLGGCVDGLELPEQVEHLISLYPWEQYMMRHMPSSVLAVPLYDEGGEVPTAKIDSISRWVHERMQEGVTLVHCQAGLNRSSLVAAAALMRTGMSAEEAIDLIREKRSPACLCNKSFEGWLLGYEDMGTYKP